MNRRERRLMQKQLGLNKHYKKETLETKFKRWEGNLENGKSMHENFRLETETFLKEQDDQRETAIIQGMAENIAKNKQIPFMDAMVEARESYQNSRKKK